MGPLLDLLDRTVGRAWRVLATAIAFASFGVGGLILWLLWFPALDLFVRDRERRVALARGAVHRTFRLFIGWMRVLGLIGFEIRHRERLHRGGLLILANHPTLIDVVFLIALVRNADCVVKSTLASNPFTRGPVRSTAYICNNSGADLLQSCMDSLAASGNLIIFPEGTRTRPGEPLRMQRGAAQIATRAVQDITPVTIRCTPLGLTKGQPWWQVASRRLHFDICVGEDIAVAPFLTASGGEPALAARRLTDHLIHYFSNERGSHAGAGT